MSESTERAVDAYLATMRLLEQAVDPAVITAHGQHEEGLCCPPGKLGSRACPGRRAEWEVYTPLRFAIPILGKARYRPAIPLLSQCMTEAADCNCRMIAAEALEFILNGPPPMSPFGFFFGASP